MNKQCPRCNLNNSRSARTCVRCLFDLREVSVENTGGAEKRSIFRMLFRRAIICLLVVILTIGGFYYSLIFSSKSLTDEEKATVTRAIDLLESKGFTKEVFYLRHLTAFRANDHWLNASVPKENAYAATNYPFEIMTLYPDFFTYTENDTERAAILLHEAKHLEGFDEKVAYEFVWKNRKKLGWTKEEYKNTLIWNEIRKQTLEFAPGLFVCDFNEYNDCTE
jgi:hypothetical protein